MGDRSLNELLASAIEIEPFIGDIRMLGDWDKRDAMCKRLRAAIAAMGEPSPCDAKASGAEGVSAPSPASDCVKPTLDKPACVKQSDNDFNQASEITGNTESLFSKGALIAERFELSKGQEACLAAEIDAAIAEATKPVSVDLERCVRAINACCFVPGEISPNLNDPCWNTVKEARMKQVKAVLDAAGVKYVA